MKTITMSCMNRPNYTRQVLDSLKNQNKPLDDYKLFINIDTGNCKEVVDICNSIDFIETDIKIFTFDEGRVNQRVNRNTYDVVSRAFAKSDFNLYLEDDIVISPDALNLMDWYIEQDLKDIASICLCNIWDKNYKEDVLYKARFSCFWGFAISRYQFEKYFRPAWFTGFSWDTSIAKYIRTFEGIHNITPQYSRASNIGEKGVNNSMHWEKFMHGHEFNQDKGKKFDYKLLWNITK